MFWREIHNIFSQKAHAICNFNNIWVPWFQVHTISNLRVIIDISIHWVVTRCSFGWKKRRTEHLLVVQMILLFSGLASRIKTRARLATFNVKLQNSATSIVHWLFPMRTRVSHSFYHTFLPHSSPRGERISPWRLWWSRSFELPNGLVDRYGRSISVMLSTRHTRGRSSDRVVGDLSTN